MSQSTGKLLDMTENSDPRPAVIVEYNLTWPGAGGHEDDTVEIPRDEWEAMTPAERTRRCEEIAVEAANNRFSWGWHIADQADYDSTEELR
jgi:hypothetical protein